MEHLKSIGVFLHFIHATPYLVELLLLSVQILHHVFVNLLSPTNNGPEHRYGGLIPRSGGMLKLEVGHCKESYFAGIAVLEAASKLSPKVSD
jgi:hypothetical protein